MTDEAPPPTAPSPAPPARRDVTSLPDAPHGIPFLTRLANRSDQKTYESFTAVERAINAHLEALARQVELKGQLLTAQTRWATRLEHLDVVRTEAVIEINQELRSITKGAEIAAKSQDLELARLELELKKARMAADALDAATPDATVEPEPTLKTRLDDIFAQVRDTEEALDAHIASIIEAAGGEEKLTEEDRRHLDQVRMLKADLIPGLYEGLRA